ncbi:MAG: AI-2E family transporter, partial [Candidatus Limnocylindrales bacterium]
MPGRSSPPVGFELTSPSARSEAATWFARGVGLVAGGILVFGVATALVNAASVLLLVLLALLIASALRPIVDWLRVRLPIGRGVAILAVYATFFGAVTAAGFLLVPVIVNQSVQLAGQLPAVDARLESWSHGLQPPELASSVGALISAARAALSHGPVPGPGQVVSAG